ncbi:palmitoyltransferase ZDHHC6-like [Aricia agestis]|uniref:palmitoyltransferase ZDHHC6-like n=1 Tax=Aricia agestis TaxID=91739 RepID=UPI001C2025BB|nr:palmitoyltransferase ZDHHC6-like [Aricia agestis]
MPGPFKRLLHWGPIAVLCIIKLITWAMVHMIGMWWPPTNSVGGALHAATFLTLAVSTLYYFLQALLVGPGFVPHGWGPKCEIDEKKLQFCSICNGFKAPRSHHCKKCGHCVLKMDHHCPWINCCVGHLNHKYFVYFLLSAVLGCLHASVVLIICLYHAVHRFWYIQYGRGDEPIIYVTLTTLLLTLLATGMAVGVVLAVGALFYLQIRGILNNRTTIEEWIIEKAVCRRQEQGLPPFQFPYDLGYKENLRLFRDGEKYDGINWIIAEGCGEYDLTVEQKAQKVEKLERSRVYVARAAYSGRWVPLCAYTRAALAPPCSDEPRLPLVSGDTIRATRRRRHWLFGERLTRFTGPKGPRGWFPRECVAPYDKNKPD